MEFVSGGKTENLMFFAVVISCYAFLLLAFVFGLFPPIPFCTAPIKEVETQGNNPHKHCHWQASLLSRPPCAHRPLGPERPTRADRG